MAQDIKEYRRDVATGIKEYRRDVATGIKEYDGCYDLIAMLGERALSQERPRGGVSSDRARSALACNVLHSLDKAWRR